MKTQMSGTTLCSVFLSGNCLFTINIGDSRALIVRENGEFEQLTTDHTPDEPEEEERILQEGGIVAQNGKGAFKIWNEKLVAPGLHLSRSIGDNYAKTLGCSSEPEIKMKILDENDKYLFIATQGIYKKLTNEEICSIIKDHSSASGAAQEIMRRS